MWVLPCLPRNWLDQYDAVLLSCGASNPRDLPVPGRDAQGVYFAVDYLSSVTKSLLDSDLTDKRAISAGGKSVIVIGGGDTGNDCTATAIRQGCKDIIQLEMMPAPPVIRTVDNAWPSWPRILKVDYGQEEAIALYGQDPRRYQTTVKEFLKDEAGHLRGVVISCLSPQKNPDSGRTLMVPTGEEYELPAELVLIAAGFTGCQSYVAESFGLTPDERGRIQTQDFQTEIPGLFACGDMRRGQSLVVWALREGGDAAAAVDQYLMGYTNL